ncbi:MAG: MFS transporter [Nocardioidaceae bacterium]
MSTDISSSATRRRVPLYGWLTAELVSLCGTRLSMIAIPWLVLTTTDSASLTGLVGFAEMAPYVLARAGSGPLIDRIGGRRVGVLSDSASMLTVAVVPALHAIDALTLPVLLGLVVLLGVFRGPGDAAKHALVPDVVDAAEVPMERATGLASAAERLAATAGAALAGLLVAAVGPANALLVDAASFGVAALLIGLSAPRTVNRGEGDDDALGYVARLRSGWEFLRNDKVLIGITVMLAVTNLLDMAYTVVLVPVWARDGGFGAETVGLLFGVFSAASVGGAVIAAAIGHRLPRFLTYLVAFLMTGAPRFVVLAFDVPLWGVLAVAVSAGFASGFLNPILGAVLFERIPRPLVGRVTALSTSLCWVGIPLGGVVGGLLVTATGLAPGLLACGAAYFLATMLPAVRPAFREMDHTPEVPASRREPVGVDR